MSPTVAPTTEAPMTTSEAPTEIPTTLAPTQPPLTTQAANVTTLSSLRLCYTALTRI
jgi:hypothetical protein